ncbi:hypothetical protein B9G79_18100 [Bdellovibrio bacteriovorus]|uniref:Uncharacterized protein n=1 Tax=Bdellovibrio bacteriovorus TaxID=959 RepID=A0A1Z3ND05_BDEBC|nr:hypothetical protein B9G79_18100 [Bdellovibrio bacteriovorus]
MQRHLQDLGNHARRRPGTCKTGAKAPGVAKAGFIAAPNCVAGFANKIDAGPLEHRSPCNAGDSGNTQAIDALHHAGIRRKHFPPGRARFKGYVAGTLCLNDLLHGLHCSAADKQFARPVYALATFYRYIAFDQCAGEKQGAIA